MTNRSAGTAAVAAVPEGRVKIVTDLLLMCNEHHIISVCARMTCSKDEVSRIACKRVFHTVGADPLS